MCGKPKNIMPSIYLLHYFIVRINGITCYLIPLYISLFTEVAPQLVYKFIEQTMQPGPSVSLKCSATGNPTPQITWTLDGFHMPNVRSFKISLDEINRIYN